LLQSWYDGVMNTAELAAYHLKVQAREIADMAARTEPFETELAGLTLTVLPHVYPGGVDSELMCAAMGDTTGKSVLDLCTGTGVVALAAAHRGAASVTAVDLNPAAVQNTHQNIAKLGFAQVEALEGSLFEPVGNQTFDIITINPPYTGKKPANKTEICFWDEENATTRQFFEQYKQHLNPGGKAYLGWADFSSLSLIEDLAKANKVSLELVASKTIPSGLATFLVYQLTDLTHWGGGLHS
jgi:methylase of polypeptide subunit release factors